MTCGIDACIARPSQSGACSGIAVIPQEGNHITPAITPRRVLPTRLYYHPILLHCSGLMRYHLHKWTDSPTDKTSIS
jgi:hypothetical protein